MSENDFLNRRFKPFSEIEYVSKSIKNIDGEYGAIVPCMILAIDFEEQLFKVLPFPDGIYEEKPFWVRYENCEIPKSKPKLTVLKPYNK